MCFFRTRFKNEPFSQTLLDDPAGRQWNTVERQATTIEKAFTGTFQPSMLKLKVAKDPAMVNLRPSLVDATVLPCCYTVSVTTRTSSKSLPTSHTPIIGNLSIIHGNGSTYQQPFGVPFPFVATPLLEIYNDALLATSRIIDLYSSTHGVVIGLPCWADARLPAKYTVLVARCDGLRC